MPLLEALRACEAKRTPRPVEFINGVLKRVANGNGQIDAFAMIDRVFDDGCKNVRN